MRTLGVIKIRLKPPCTRVHNKDMNRVYELATKGSNINGGSTANKTENIKLSNYNKLILNF